MSCTTPDHSACITCSLLPFCLAEETKSHSATHGHDVVRQHRTLRRNEVLYLPNNKFQNLYVIQEGALKTYQVIADGKESIRGFYFAGEVLGYEAIFTGLYFHSAVALDDTLLCEIPYNNILEMLQTRPALQKHILSLLSQQLNRGSYLISTNAEQRLAAFLIDISARLHGTKIKLEFSLPMSRQDIGNYLNLTAETVSRLFSRLQKNQLINIQHKDIKFLQLKKLQQIANGILASE